MNSLLEININNMLKDISKRKSPKKELLEKYVKIRLQKSLDSYQKQLQEDYSILTNRDINKVTKKL